MHFREATAEVLNIVARPDKAAEIDSAVNWAISHCCLKADFSFDLVEASFAINQEKYGDTVPMLSSLTRFRKFAYIKPYGQLYYLTPIASSALFTSGQLQRDCYYVAGNNVTYTLSRLAPSLECGYYTYPPVLSGSDTFWLLDKVPWAAIDLACARLFRSIGDDTSARHYQLLGEDLLKEARRDFERGVAAIGA